MTEPKGKEMSQRLLKLPARSPVLVYRTRPKERVGPYRFITVQGETAGVQMAQGSLLLRSTCVKRYVECYLS